MIIIPAAPFTCHLQVENQNDVAEWAENNNSDPVSFQF